MPRNLTDLPLNDDPQDTDWLLGASGISPAVFQKIPVGLVKAPSGGGGGSIFVPINTPTTLTEGGLFFTDTLAENLGIDCSELPLGSRITWVNLSTKSVILYGFSTANGTIIPTNKGIRLGAGNTLDLFVKNGMGWVQILSGLYSFTWIPGLEPPGFIFWRFEFDGSLSEIQADWGLGLKTLTSANGVNIFEVSGFIQKYPSFSAISDNYFIANNSQYLGGGLAIMRCEFIDFQSIQTIALAPQASGVIYNAPSYFKILASIDGSVYSEEWTIALGTGGNHSSPFKNTSLRPGVLTSYNKPLS